MILALAFLTLPSSLNRSMRSASWSTSRTVLVLRRRLTMAFSLVGMWIRLTRLSEWKETAPVATREGKSNRTRQKAGLIRFGIQAICVMMGWLECSESSRRLLTVSSFLMTRKRLRGVRTDQHGYLLGWARGEWPDNEP